MYAKKVREGTTDVAAEHKYYYDKMVEAYQRADQEGDCLLYTSPSPRD